MKKVLYYAIKLGSLYGPQLVAVTTERAGRWWGRDMRDDMGSHGKTMDLAGHFETAEQANLVMREVNNVVLHFAGEMAKLEAGMTRLRGAKQQMLRQVCRQAPQRGAEMLTVKVEISK